MKYHVNAEITEITEWEKDTNKMSGDMSHMSEADVYSLLAEELYDKKDNRKDPPGLPFSCEFDVESNCEDWLTEDEVKDVALDMYCEKYMEFDYVVPVDCEIEYSAKEQEETCA